MRRMQVYVYLAKIYSVLWGCGDADMHIILYISFGGMGDAGDAYISLKSLRFYGTCGGCAYFS